VSIRTLFLNFAVTCLALYAAIVQANPAPVILVLGDSLSAAHGIQLQQGWVALLQRRLESGGYGYEVVNASASGETTGGALARLPRALERHHPVIVIVELGGNDGLRGLPIADLKNNLESLIEQAVQSDARVLLIGMRIPPNYGPAYTNAFHDLYGELAARHELPLVPFFLDGVALDDSLMQDDGIHPNADAQEALLNLVWSKLEPMLTH
jgi:acyl-CoA thioesterase-1